MPKVRVMHDLAHVSAPDAWCADARARSVFEVAGYLALRVEEGVWIQCPACRRHRAGATRDHWHCPRCKRGGTVIDVVSVAIAGAHLFAALDVRSRREVQRWFAEHGPIDESPRTGVATQEQEPTEH